MELQLTEAAPHSEAMKPESMHAMQARIDDILAANAGDARAAIECLLLFADAMSDTISFGYVRGRIESGRHDDG